MLNKTLDWRNPAAIDAAYIWKNEKILIDALKLQYPDLDDITFNKVEFVYAQYRYLTLQLKPLLDMGYGLVKEKTEWLLEQYLNHLIGDFVEPIPEYRRLYQHPDFGSLPEWFEYIDSLYDAFYGGFTPHNVSVLKKMNETSTSHRGGYYRV